MEHNAKNICKAIISSKEQKLNTQIAEFAISILFNTSCTFWKNSILSQSLENQFHHSILRGNPDRK